MSRFDEEDVMMMLDDMGACPNEDLDWDVANEWCEDKLEMDLTQFTNAVNFLIDYTPSRKLSLTGVIAKGFVNKEENMYVLKKEVT